MPGFKKPEKALPMSFDQLLLAGESQTLEFKTSFDKTTVESLVAFANAQGGKVLVGVSDAGLIHGVTLGKETLNEWLGQIKSATSPSLIPDLVAENVDGKTVGIIQVSEFPVKPVSTRGRYFKRVASSNHQLGLAEIANLYMQSLQLSWDAYEAPNESLDALSLPKINRFISQVNDSGRFALESEPLAALEKLKYIVNGQPTWAALLLFAKEPLRHHIHIGRFKTPSMIIDDRQFTDTLFEVVDQSMKFIISYISVAFEFDGSIQRKERFATRCPPCAKHCSMRSFTALTPMDRTSRSKYSTTKSRFSVPAPFTAASAWPTSRPITTAPACATNWLRKAFTSPATSKNTVAASFEFAKHCATTPRSNLKSKNLPAG
jgi:ATP-dependent DNA helicase RecG